VSRGVTPARSRGLREPEVGASHVGDRRADRDRGGGGWGRGVEHVHHALGLDDAEVVDELAGGLERLGPHPGAGRVHVVEPELGQQLL